MQQIDYKTTWAMATAIVILLYVAFIVSNRQHPIILPIIVTSILALMSDEQFFAGLSM